ncbi:hypothetical protein OO009_02565 [Flavobacteriaceae bacterium KMM 6897]|nr:hypothetical protein [Flavobacteriaceae bacterium KMM 6897]
MQRIAIFCFLIFLCSGCKDINPNEKTIGVADSFMITLSIIVKKEDVIEIFYLDSKDDEIKFSEEKKIRKSVEGSNDVQTLSFKLPIEVLSNTFRVDLGNNMEQNTVSFKNIIFKSQQRELTIEGNEMEWFFTVNKYLKYKGNGEYQIIEIDGRVDPFIVSKAVLNKKLEIEL